VRQALGGLAIALAAIVVACGDGGVDERFDAGPVEDFPVGSVTTIAHVGGAEIARAVDGIWSGIDELPEGSLVLHLVHGEGGEIWALSPGDLRVSCAVPWQPNFHFEGERGWFRKPCTGQTYDTTGRQVSGEASRDLDRYPVEVRDGHVLVDLSEDALIPGEVR